MLTSVLLTFSVQLLFTHITNAATVEGRIIDGTTAVDRQFPFAAAVHSIHPDATYVTGGTLITSEYVLTRAGSPDEATSVRVVLGSIEVSPPESDSNSRSVTVILVTSVDDLTLLRLETPVALSDYIKPISFLASSSATALCNVLTLGWGMTAANSGMSGVLHYISLSIIDNEACVKEYGSWITDDRICGTGMSKQGICGSDIGGPLFYYNGDDVYLVGVAHSYHADCVGGPSVFVRIDTYMDWISSTTGAKMAM